MDTLRFLNKKVLLKSFATLYATGKNAIKGIDEASIAYSSKGVGDPVKVVSVLENLDKIPFDEKFLDFVSNKNKIWCIPLESPTLSTYGYFFSYFDLKTSEKSFSYFSVLDEFLLFGFYKFREFKHGYPIVLVEGVKDALFVQQFYPFVIALFTNSLDIRRFNLLRTATDNFVLFFDSDAQNSMAEKNVKRAAANLEERIINSGARVRVCWPAKKDPATFFTFSEAVQQAAIKQVRNSLLVLDKRTITFLKHN